MTSLKSNIGAALVIMALPMASMASEPLLTVTGDVANAPDGTAWIFDADDLRSLPAVSFQTETIWTEGSQTFEGVSLQALLEHVGAEEGELLATAANDYSVTIPTSDAVTGGPIIAYLRNGENMPLRDKGPLWVIYPFQDNCEYKSEEYYSRSIWQLDRINVVAND